MPNKKLSSTKGREFISWYHPRRSHWKL